jgi:Flp pilus assembly protein TadG
MRGAVRAATSNNKDSGSVLMLMPAAVLIVLILGSIAFDFSLVYLRQRQAINVAAAAANDAVVAGIDLDEFRRSQTVELDHALVEQAAANAIAGSDLAADIVDWDVRIISDTEVEVWMSVRIEYVFAKALPGASDGAVVEARATAVSESA